METSASTVVLIPVGITTISLSENAVLTSLSVQESPPLVENSQVTEVQFPVALGR